MILVAETGKQEALYAMPWHAIPIAVCLAYVLLFGPVIRGTIWFIFIARSSI